MVIHTKDYGDRMLCIYTLFFIHVHIYIYITYQQWLHIMIQPLFNGYNIFKWFNHYGYIYMVIYVIYVIYIPSLPSRPFGLRWTPWTRPRPPSASWCCPRKLRRRTGSWWTGDVDHWGSWKFNHQTYSKKVGFTVKMVVLPWKMVVLPWKMMVLLRKNGDFTGEERWIKPDWWWLTWNPTLGVESTVSHRGFSHQVTCFHIKEFITWGWVKTYGHTWGNQHPVIPAIKAISKVKPRYPSFH